MHEYYFLHKTIPVERKRAYQNLGWSSSGDKYVPGGVHIRRVLQIQSKDRLVSDCGITSEVRIHNGLLRRPFGLHDYKPLHLAVLFSEDDDLAWKQRLGSVWRMWAQAPLYQAVEVDRFAVYIGSSPHLLWVYANFDSQDIKTAYLSVLADFFSGVRVEGGPLEICRVGTKLVLDPSADFWWDTKNDVMFSFDRQFIFRLPNHLQATFHLVTESLQVKGA